MKKRLDLFLHEMKLVSSRTKAQDLIYAGAIYVNDKIMLRPSFLVDAKDRVDIRDSDELKFVSRGGLKLSGALKHLSFDVTDFEVLDVGISTGGFSDCLLKNGVKKILGVDVGQGQLHPSLHNLQKLKLLEKVNARDMHQNSHVLNEKPKQGWDLATIDVSFVSLQLVLPAVSALVKDFGFILALVKPQFEVGPSQLNKNGIVKDDKLFVQLEVTLKEKCAQIGLQVKDYFSSAIEGKDGNREFFIFLQKQKHS